MDRMKQQNSLNVRNKTRNQSQRNKYKLMLQILVLDKDPGDFSPGDEDGMGIKTSNILGREAEANPLQKV